jgi:hypothetical protein
VAIEQAQTQEYAKRYGQLVARAWGDAAFKRRLLAEPAPVLAEPAATASTYWTGS